MSFLSSSSKSSNKNSSNESIKSKESLNLIENSILSDKSSNSSNKKLKKKISKVNSKKSINPSDILSFDQSNKEDSIEINLNLKSTSSLQHKIENFSNDSSSFDDKYAPITIPSAFLKKKNSSSNSDISKNNSNKLNLPEINLNLLSLKSNSGSSIDFKPDQKDNSSSEKIIFC